MIKEIATVTAISGEQVKVTSSVTSSCSACNQLNECGSGQVAKAFSFKHAEFTINTNKKVAVGDTVEIGLPENVILSAAWQVYMWPIIGLILGSIFGQFLMSQLGVNHELPALVIGVLFGYLGFCAARTKQLSSEKSADWQVKLIKILPKKHSYKSN